MQSNETAQTITLLPGDLILYRVCEGCNFLDRLIGLGQKWIHQAPSKNAYCHVGIVGPDSEHIYEAAWPAVRNRAFDLKDPPKGITLEVYRVKDSTPAQIAAVMDYCRRAVGQTYDVVALFTLGLISVRHSPYCSLLAWRAWINAGVLLCADEYMVTPDDIAASALLVQQ